MVAGMTDTDPPAPPRRQYRRRHVDVAPPPEAAPPPVKAPRPRLPKPKTLSDKESSFARHAPLAARQAMYARFREHTETVLQTLLDIVNNDEADPGHRIAAGKEILNRGWGSVPQHHIVEQSLEHRVTVNTAALGALTQAQLLELESVMVTLLGVPDAEVIEGTAESGPDEDQDDS